MYIPVCCYLPCLSNGQLQFNGIDNKIYNCFIKIEIYMLRMMNDASVVCGLFGCEVDDK